VTLFVFQEEAKAKLAIVIEHGTKHPWNLVAHPVSSSQKNTN